MKEPFKERINYTISDKGVYVGEMVNVPAVMQAHSLDELKTQARDMTKLHIDFLQKLLDNDRFEFIDQTKILSTCKTTTNE